jgi:predicted metal-binding protein
LDLHSKNLKAHLFICTNTKSDGSGCGPLNASHLVDELKPWIKENGLKEQLKVTRSGCLGHCQEGVAAVCYPQNQWFTKLASTDGNQLKELLKSQLAD